MSTGGKSYSKTGSDGHGYEIAEGFGHTIIKTLPALVQLIGDFKYCKDWDGIRIDSKISLYENNKFIKEEFGELQLTSYGISGICAMQLSGDISRGLDNNKCEDVVINFLPFINDSSELLEWLNKRNNVLKNRNISELLDGVINYKLVNIILKISNIDDTRWDMLDDSKKVYL